MEPTKLSGVIFDADGVLQHTGPFWSEDWVWSLKRHETFVRGFYASLTPGERTEMGAFRTAFERAIGATDWPHDAQTYLDRWSERSLTPDPAMLEDVRRLKAAGVACYLGTNQDAFWAAHVEEKLGYGALFDKLFISSRLGAAKPEAAFYEAMLAQIPYPRDELIFFDDKADNVEAAIACGLPARLFTDRATYLRDLEAIAG